MNFHYSYICPECKSELEFKSMNKPSDEVMCMCGSNMDLVRFWAKSFEIYKNGGQSLEERNSTI